MTQTNHRLLDEIARLATDAAAVAQGARREVETVVRSQIERLLAEANVVPREEFEAVKSIATRAAEEAERLRARVEALEARLGEANHGGANHTSVNQSEVYHERGPQHEGEPV